jgi:hypothetical protein
MPNQQQSKGTAAPTGRDLHTAHSMHATTGYPASSIYHHNSHRCPCCTSKGDIPVCHTAEGGLPTRRTTTFDSPMRGTPEGGIPTGYLRGCSPQMTQQPSTTHRYTSPHIRTPQQTTIERQQQTGSVFHFPSVLTYPGITTPNMYHWSLQYQVGSPLLKRMAKSPPTMQANDKDAQRTTTSKRNAQKTATQLGQSKTRHPSATAQHYHNT